MHSVVLSNSQRYLGLRGPEMLWQTLPSWIAKPGRLLFCDKRPNSSIFNFPRRHRSHDGLESACQVPTPAPSFVLALSSLDPTVKKQACMYTHTCPALSQVSNSAVICDHKIQLGFRLDPFLASRSYKLFPSARWAPYSSPLLGIFGTGLAFRTRHRHPRSVRHRKVREIGKGGGILAGREGVGGKSSSSKSERDRGRRDKRIHMK